MNKQEQQQLIKKEFKKLIKQKNVNISSLARALGINQSTFFSLYYGNYVMPTNIVIRVATILDIDLNELKKLFKEKKQNVETHKITDK